MSDENLKTALFDWHVANSGKMVDFAGWSMPIQYRSIMEEHVATRASATLFDVSHMGRFELTGSSSEAFLDRVSTRKIQGMSEGQIRYSLLCNSKGGVLDDVLVYRIDGAGELPDFGMVVNAGNRVKVYEWLQEQILLDENVNLVDITLATTMIAIQGPRALEMANVDFPMASQLRYFTGTTIRPEQPDRAGQKIMVSRTGYTGEDGIELILPNEIAEATWVKLIAQGAIPAGLGARDTLRLESAMPLYGHELSEDMNAAQAGLRFAISLKDREFIGRSAIEDALNDPQLPIRVGLELDGRRVAREGAQIFHGELELGVVTSGTFSPSLERSIAMGYVSPEIGSPDQNVEVDIRGKRIPARVVKLPFYKRK